jgi:hypothetical protein
VLVKVTGLEPTLTVIRIFSPVWPCSLIGTTNAYVPDTDEFAETLPPAGLSSPLSLLSSLHEFALLASVTVTTLSSATGGPPLLVNVKVNLTAGLPDCAPGPVPDDVIECTALSATVTPPTVGVAVGGTGVGVPVAVGVGTAVSLAGADGDFVTAGSGVVFAGVAFELGLAVGCAVEPADVPAAATAEATAVAGAELVGDETATTGDDTAALGSALDATAVAGLDDAALLLCDELEHP